MLQRLKEGKNRVPAPADLRCRARISAPGAGDRGAASAAQPGLRQRTGHHDPARNPRRHHHRLHLVFCLEGDKKAPGDNFLITGWHLTDACEIWLEALKRTGRGPSHRRPAGASRRPRRRRFFPSATGCWSPAANSPLPARGRSNSGSSRSSPSR